MIKHTPSSLLSFADLYETQAFLALAQHPGQLSVSLKREVSSISGAFPTDEQWTSWLHANSTVLNKIAHLKWYPFGDKAMATIRPFPDEITAWLTKTPHPPHPEFGVASQAILRASPPIPTLWLWVGSREAYVRPPLSPELAHEAWLVDVLQTLHRARPQEAARFIQENKSAINKVRSFFHQSPKHLGSGVDGVAFDIGQGRVLKVFRDRISFIKAVEAVERLYKQPQLAKTEAMIYDIGTLGKWRWNDEDPGHDIYYYIMEKMTPVRGGELGEAEPSITAIRDDVYEQLAYHRDDKWRPLKKKMSDPTQINAIKSEVIRAAKNITDNIKISLSDRIRQVEDIIPGLRDTWLRSYVEEIIVKYLTGRTDLHIGNLGVTGYGELRYYDPAYNEAGSGTMA